MSAARRWLGSLALLLCCGPSGAAEQYVSVPGAALRSVLSAASPQGEVTVSAFSLRRQAVSLREFLAFTDAHPAWQRSRVPLLLADHSYLHQWRADDEVGSALELAAAVTNVSWHAAQAYCRSEQARLPTWLEWELVAAADATRRDARTDPAWRAVILDWYSSAAIPATPVPNVYGVSGIHGQIWEWVADFNALLISADSRTQGDPDRLQFCGAGAISLQNKEDYAILMRVAFLSALGGASTTDHLGFRCARDIKSNDVKEIYETKN